MYSENLIKYRTKPKPSKAEGKSMSGRAAFVSARQRPRTVKPVAEAALVIACRERRDDKIDQSERRIKTAYHHRAQSHRVSYKLRGEREGEREQNHTQDPLLRYSCLSQKKNSESLLGFLSSPGFLSPPLAHRPLHPPPLAPDLKNAIFVTDNP